MATSPTLEINNATTMQARKLLSLLTILLLSTYPLFAQSYLIPVNIPANKYPITFTDATQKVLVVAFDRDVLSIGTTAGWKVYIGGGPGTIAVSSVTSGGGNLLRITLVSSITYANRNLITVSYNAGIGSMSLIGPVMPNFVGIQAVNNYIAVATDFVNGLYGENAPKDICAPVEFVEIEYHVVVSSKFRNSIHFVTPYIYIQWFYPVDLPNTSSVMVESAPGTGLFKSIEIYASYPDNTLNCTWDINVFPYVFGSGSSLQPVLYVTQNAILISIPNYKKDNHTPAPGTGTLGLDPPVDHISTLFCVGSSITNFPFTDATVFDCQLAVEPDLPNIQPRYVQYVYGTQTGAGIPNVFIKVGATNVQVTDAAGVSISGLWHINPDGTANIPGYPTPSGFFEGPVIQYTWDAFTKLRTTPLAQTYPISHTGDFINDVVGDIFDVTLRNWGPCNQWLGDYYSSDAPVTEFSRLRLVLSPPLPTANPVTVCLGGSTALSATRNGADPAGVLHWYNNSDLLLIHEVATGTSYNPAPPALPAGVTNYWVREIVAGGCMGPAKQVVLTIYPTLTASISGGTTPICYNTAPGAFTATGGGGNGTYLYLWYKNGASTGVTTQTYTPGNLTSTSTFYCAISSSTCGPVNTSTTTITVYANLASTITPASTSICYNTSPGNFTATPSGGTGTYTYLWYKNGATTGITTQTYTPGNLTTTSTFYCAVTSGTCGTVSTSTTTITVYATLTSAISGGSSPICYNTAPGTFTATGGGGTGTYTYLWYKNGTTTGVTTQTYAPGNLTASASFYCAITSGTCGTVNTGTTSITVYATLASTITPASTSICYNTSPGNFTATPSGGTGIYTYLWYKNGATTGITTQTYTPGNLTTTSTFYCAVTSGICGTVNTLTTTITVYASLASTITPASTSICYNISPGTFTATPSGGTGTYTYLWYKDGATTGITTQTYTPGNLTATSTFYCAVTSGTCGTVSTSTTTITVYATLTSAISGGSSPICYNTAPGTFTATGGGGTGTYTYLWYKNGTTTGVTTQTYAPGNLTASASFYCAITSGSCGTVNTGTTTITVNPVPTPVISGSNNVCRTNSVNYSTPSVAGNTYLWSTVLGTITSLNSANPVTILWNTNGAGSITLKETITATGCAVTTTAYAVTVNPGTPGAAGVITGPANVCYGEPGVGYSITAVANATSYVWTVPGGIIATGAGTNSITVNFTPGAADFSITVYPHNGCGDGATATKAIAIYPIITASISGGTTPLCYNTAPGTFTATGGGGTGTYTYLWYKDGLTTGVTIQTYAPGNLTATSAFYCAITSGTCGTVNTGTTTITVYANLTAGISGGTTPLCYNAAPGTFTATGGGGTGAYTYLWYKNGVTTGITTQTYTPGNLTATSTFYCAITSGTCGTVNTSTTSITVYGNLTASISGGITPLCYNTAPGTFTATGGGGTGTYTYLWYKNGASTGVTTQTYAPGNLTSSSTFYCAITSGTCGTVNTGTTSITVYADLTAVISGGLTPLCYNTAPGTFTATGGGGNLTYTYLWYKDGLTTGVTTQTYTPGNLTATATVYCAITSGSCGPVNTGTATITVYGNLTAAISGGTSPICYNAAPGIFTATGGGGTGVFTYLWYKDGLTTGVATQTYTPGNLTATSTFYCAITSGSCGTVNTGTTSITVYATLTAAISGGTTPICYNTAPGTFTATGGGGNLTYTYLWYKNGVSTGVSTQTYTPGNLTAISTFYCEITSGTCGTVNTGTTTITVYGDLTAGLIIGGTSPICYNTNEGTLTANASAGDGSYTYEWFKDGATTGITTSTYAAGVLTVSASYYYKVTSCGQTKQSSTVNVTVRPDLVQGAISGSTTPVCYNANAGIYTANPSGGNGTYTYEWFKDGITTGITTQTYAAGVLTASANYFYKVTSCGQTKQSATVNIVVNADLTIGTISGSTSPICYNSNAGTFTANPTGGDGTFTYEWFKNGVTTGITTATYAAGVLIVNANYYYKATSCGQTKQSPTVNVTVHPDLLQGAISGTTTPICSNTDEGTLSANPTGGDGTYTYEWFKDGVTTGINTQTYAAGVLTVNASYYVKVTSCGQTKQTTPVVITVNPLPIVSTIIGEALLCNNATNKVYEVVNHGGSTYAWTVPGAILTKAFDASLYFILVDAVGPSGSGNIQVTETITATGCFASATPLNVTVSPVSPGAVVAGPPIVCQGSAGVVYSVPDNIGSTYSWIIPPGASITSNPALHQILVTFSSLGGQVSVIETTSGGCSTVHVPITIIVNPAPAITNITATICSGGSFTSTPANGTDGNVPAGTTYSWAAPSITGDITGGAAGAAAANISGTLVNPTSTFQTAIYTVTPVTGTCTGATFTVTVLVNPKPAVNNMAATICSAGSFTASPVDITDGIVPAGTIYSWAAPAVTGGITGGTAGNNAAAISGTLFNPTNSVATAIYTVTPKSGSCTGAIFTVILTVDPKPAISNMTATICSAGSFMSAPANGVNGIVPATITYTWSAPSVTGGLTGGASGTAAADISGTLTNPTNTTQIAIYTVTPTSGGCTGSDFTVTVTMSPMPAINNMVNTACSGVSFTSAPANGVDGVVPIGTTYTWAAPGITGGLTGGAAGTNAANISGSLTNPTNIPQTATYTVTPKSGSCTGVSFTVAVTVDPKPAITAMAATICSTGNFTSAPADGLNGIVPAGTTYTWAAPAVTGGILGGAAGTNAADVNGSLTNPTNTSQTAIYTVTPKSVSCNGTPFTVTVTVDPKPSISNMSATICSGGGFTAAPVEGTNGIVPAATTYTWPLPVVTGLMTGGAAGTAAANISGTLTNPTSTVQTATYTVTPTSGTCPGATFTVIVTVNPMPVVNNLIALICSSGSFITAPVNLTDGIVPAGTTYTWPAPVVTGGITGGAAGTNALTVSGTLTNPTNIQQTATYTVTPKSGGCIGAPFTVIVTVDPKPAITNMISTICSAGSFTAAPTNGVNGIVPGTTTYTWSAPTVTGGITGGLAGIAAANISGTLTNPTNTAQTAIYTVTPSTASCTGVSFTVTVTIDPKPSILNMTATICSGGTFTSLPANGLDGVVPAGTTYTWVAPVVTGGISGGAAGTAAANISGTLVNPTNAVETATYTVIPTSGSCTGSSFTVTVTVNPKPNVTTASPLTICSATATNIALASNVTGAIFSWTIGAITGGVTGATASSGATIAQTLANSGTTVGTVTYIVTPTANSCPGSPTNFVVTVNPTPNVTTASPTTICNGATTNIALSSNVTGATFSWTIGTITGGVTGASSSGGATINQVLINSGTTAGTVTYIVTPTANSCPGSPTNFMVTVNPTPNVTTASPTTICNGATTNIALSSNVAGTTFTWTIGTITGSITGATPSGGSTINQTLTNPGATSGTVTYVITPIANTCPGNPVNLVVTVNPTPNVTTASPTTICSASTTNIALISNVAGATFSWTIAGVTGGLTGASASSGATIAQILVNPGTSAGTVTYRVTPTAGSCSGTPVDIIVTINPTPNVSSAGPTTICSATATNIALSSNVAGATFTWTIGTITGSITGATPSGGSTINQTLTNPGATSGTVTYVITPIANTCPGNPVNLVVTVNPKPDVTTASPTTICSATATNIALTSSVTGTTYSWTIGAVTGSVSGATASNGTTIAQTLYNSGLSAGSVTYIVTPTANSCSGVPVSIIVTVNPTTGPTTFTTGALEVCQDAPDETYTAIATNSTSIVYSVLPGTAGVINVATGVMNWNAAFFGNAIITATSTGLCGTTAGNLSVRVKELPGITVSPQNRTTCEFGLVNFDVTVTGSDLTFEWFVNDGAGFVPVPTGGIYSGETSQTLQIWSSLRGMDGYIYHVKVSGCLSDVTSADAVLTVNTAPELIKHPSDFTVCLGDNATMEADATGMGITWQWYVNKGAGFVVVVNDVNFSGATTKTLTITNALSSFNNWIFRAKATGICGVPAFTNFGRLSVINPPTVGLQPGPKVICENGDISFLGNGSGYIGLQWEVSTDNGTTFTNVVDDATYIGSATNQLSVLNAMVTLTGHQYRLGLIGACKIVYTNAATLTVNANPVVDFTAINPVFACGGVPIVINGNPTGGSGTYTQHRWTGDVGPLNDYIIQSPTFNSQISGTYNLNYRVTDSKGCTANADLAVIVDSPYADFNQDINNGCTPLTVTFTKDMTGIASFSWNFDDGSPFETVTASPVHTFTNANPSSIGYYNVKLTVLSPGGCSATFTSMVTVYPAINATFTAAPAIVCSGNQINFTTLPGASKYFWDFGDGISGYFTNSTNHLYTNLTNAAVVHTVTLTTTSFYNCSDVKYLDITVMPVPLPQFTALPVSQIYNAAGNPVTFTNTTNDGTWIWLWKFGDGSTSTDQNPVHNYTTLGTFNVILSVNNANCSDSVKHSVTVSPIPPVANFDLIPSGCSPLEIIINNTSLNTNTPGTTYMWDFGDGGASTSKNPSYFYTTPGIFRVELVVTGPGGTSNYSQVVNSYPSPKAYFELAPPIVFVNDEKVRMFNLSQGADSYLWEFGDGDTSKVRDPYHKYMEEGAYDVTLWAYIHNVINGETVTCSDKYVLTPGVTVEPAGVIRFSTVFTPNQSGPIEMDHLPTGGTEIDQFFFPPIREKVTDYKLQVFNRLGVLIFESHDINRPWNGYYHSKLCSQGVYVWYVEGKYANGMPFKKVGDVTLLH